MKFSNVVEQGAGLEAGGDGLELGGSLAKPEEVRNEGFADGELPEMEEVIDEDTVPTKGSQSTLCLTPPKGLCLMPSKPSRCRRAVHPEDAGVVCLRRRCCGCFPLTATFCSAVCAFH